MCFNLFSPIENGNYHDYNGLRSHASSVVDTYFSGPKNNNSFISKDDDGCELIRMPFLQLFLFFSFFFTNLVAFEAAHFFVPSLNGFFSFLLCLEGK